MHPRKVLRLAFKDRLTGATKAQDRVFDTMTPPIDINATLASDGPVMMVYVRHEEEREEDYQAMRQDSYFRRRIEVTIEALAIGAPGQNVDDTLDDIAEEIEGLIEGWAIPGFPAVDPLLMASQIDVTDTGNRIVGGLFMQYHMKLLSPYRPDTSAAPALPDELFIRQSMNGAYTGPRELVVGTPDADDA